MSSQTVAAVKKVEIISNSSASIIQFGDRKISRLLNNSISILQNRSSYFAGEPHFTDYAMFTQPIPAALVFLPAKHIIHKPACAYLAPLPTLCTGIEIDNIEIISNSDSSNIQFGNGEYLLAEARSKNFLQYFPDPK